MSEAERSEEGRRTPVVVGVDGTAESAHATAWALAEAGRRGLPVRLVHAYEFPPPLLPFYDAATGLGEDHLREVAAGALAGEVSRAAARAPGVDVTGEVCEGSPLEVLLAEAAGAALVVVGTRGMGPFGGLVVGSTGTALAGQAACPVVVVPAPAPDRRTEGAVVVGVDGSAPSQAAVAAAFGTAALRKVPVRAVHAWRETLHGLSQQPAPGGTGGQVEAVEHQLLLSEALSGSREAFPDVPVEGEAVREHPVRALLDAAHGASLLVLGARGAGGYPGLPLGSVAQGVLHQADCPVYVVPA